MGSERVVTIDLGPDYEWYVTMEWPPGVTSGGPMTLTIQPANPEAYPPGGISSTLLREIDFRAAVATLRRQVASVEHSERTYEEIQRRWAERLERIVSSTITDRYLAVLARTYVGAVNQGQDKPLQYLAGVTGKSVSAVKNHLWQATRRGLLERDPGRAGGRITEKAAETLREFVPSKAMSGKELVDRWRDGHPPHDS